jgi:hypothetical protein
MRPADGFPRRSLRVLRRRAAGVFRTTMGSPEGRSVTQAAPDLPTSLLRERCICFVDVGVKPDVLARYLGAIRPVLVVYQRLPMQTRQEAWPVQQIAEFHTVGDQQDEELSAAAEIEAARLMRLIAPHIPPSVRKFAAIDLVDEVLRSELQSLLVKRRRSVYAAEEALDQASGVTAGLLVRGNGAFTSVLEDWLVAQLGLGRVFTLDAEDGCLEPVPAVTALPELPVDKPASEEHEPAGHLILKEDPGKAGGPCLLAWPLRNHAMSLAPVLQELAIRGPIDVIALSDRRKDRPQYDPYLSLAETHSSISLRFDLASTSEQVASSVQSLCRAVANVTGTEVAKDVSAVPDVLRRVVIRDIVRLIGTDLPRVHGFARSIDAYFAASRPGVVIVTRERGWQNRTGALIARGRGIPTLLVQASMLARSPRHSNAPVDYATVFDSYAAGLHVDYLGLEPSRVTMTGFPGFDQIRRLALTKDPTQATRGGAHVLVAMQRGSAKDDERFIRAVLEALRSTSIDTRVTIKAHPKSPEGTVERYRQVAAGYSDLCDVLVVAGGDIQAMLQDASVVISGWSTVLVEAALCGTPSLSLTLDGIRPPIPFAEMGVAHEVHSDAELGRVLPQLLDVTALRKDVLHRQRAYLEDNGHLIDGPPAARRIASVITELTEGDPVRK